LPEWYSLVWERALSTDVSPLESKLALARFIVTRSHGEEAARAAEEHFTRVVREGQAPEEVPEIAYSEAVVHLPALLAETFGQSTSHWRRVIDQGGVRVDGRALTSYDVETASVAGDVIQAGKRQFLRIRAA
jgi:tyrosyl-tRNA synthetase